MDGKGMGLVGNREEGEWRGGRGRGMRCKDEGEASDTNDSNFAITKNWIRKDVCACVISSRESDSCRAGRN